MKAIVVLSVVPEKDSGVMRLELSAKWTDGSGPRGDLSAVQILAILEQARTSLLGGVPFDPPSALVTAGPTDMKVLGARH